jgi:hypothetical protein
MLAISTDGVKNQGVRRDLFPNSKKLGNHSLIGIIQVSITNCSLLPGTPQPQAAIISRVLFSCIL